MPPVRVLRVPVSPLPVPIPIVLSGLPPLPIIVAQVDADVAIANCRIGNADRVDQVLLRLELNVAVASGSSLAVLTRKRNVDDLKAGKKILQVFVAQVVGQIGQIRDERRLVRDTVIVKDATGPRCSGQLNDLSWGIVVVLIGIVTPAPLGHGDDRGRSGGRAAASRCQEVLERDSFRFRLLALFTCKGKTNCIDESS